MVKRASAKWKGKKREETDPMNPLLQKSDLKRIFVLGLVADWWIGEFGKVWFSHTNSLIYQFTNSPHPLPGYKIHIP